MNLEAHISAQAQHFALSDVHSLTHTHSHPHSLSSTLTLTHTHTHSHSHSHSHSLTHTHSHTHSHTPSLTITLSPTLSLSPTLIHPPSLSLTLTLTLTHTHSHTHSHPHSLTLTISLPLTHSPTLTLTHFPTQSHPHSLTRRHRHHDPHLHLHRHLSLDPSASRSLDFCFWTSHTLRIGCTELNAVPHAGLGFQFLRVQVRTTGSWRSSRGSRAQKEEGERRADKMTSWRARLRLPKYHDKTSEHRGSWLSLLPSGKWKIAGTQEGVPSRFTSCESVFVGPGTTHNCLDPLL